jgi:hypothetical protein
MKIRISCTNEDYELFLNNKKINKKNFIKKFNNKNNKFDNYDYINKVFLLTKNNNFQSLEFECNRDITEEEFKNFIEDLKKLGFQLKIIEKEFQIYIEDLENIEDLKKLGFQLKRIKPLLIQFVKIIDNKGTIIFNYDYHLIKPEKLNKNNNKYKNKSHYKQQNLYIKNILKK